MWEGTKVEGRGAPEAPRSAGPDTVSTTTERAQPPSAVMLYHRPYEDPHHGSSQHFRGFADGLRSHLSLRVVAPPYRRSNGPADSAKVLLAGARYLLRACWDWFRFVGAECRVPRDQRAQILISFDIYAAGIAAFWARIQSKPFVYCPQDTNRQVARYWSESGYRGGWLFRVVRAPLEFVALRSAQLVVVPSKAMANAFRKDGFPPDKLRLCTLKRELPTFRAEDVNRWRHRLGVERGQAAVFVGSFQYPPNVRAFEFLRTTVARALKESESPLTIIVAGLGSEAFAATEEPNFKVVGTVDDLDGLLFACSVGLAPMDVAGGTSGKIIDYVLHGLVAFATPEAAQGVASSPSIRVIPLDGFVEALRRWEASPAMERPVHDRPPLSDPYFVAQYTGSEEIGILAAEIASLESRPAVNGRSGGPIDRVRG